MATITASPRPLRRTRTFESLQDVMPSAGPSNTDSLASSSSATSATTSSQPSHDVDANRGDEPKARGRTWTVDSSEDSMPQAGPSNIPSSFGSPPQPSTATLTGGRGFVPLPGRELIRTTRSLMCPASPPALATLPSPSQLPYVANPDSGPPPPRKHRSPTSPTNTEPLGYDPCPPGQREIMQTLREMGIKVRDFEYEEGTKELRRALMRRETVSTVVSEDNASDGGRGEQVSASYTNPPASTELGTSTDNTVLLRHPHP
ncbi:hypothetical protein OE88DRAFT_1531804 [Heliocybe sulcata]|uniref:Uncharacterized protein n=1 Tax=Heliocybe sulcata TaxID=5364 RepID=A0A5C3N4F0_9AGAM|nr:hypothetical protein OE88DRAFT_1531804 [Heliocybe sulcata]